MNPYPTSRELAIEEQAEKDRDDALDKTEKIVDVLKRARDEIEANGHHRYGDASFTVQTSLNELSDMIETFEGEARCLRQLPVSVDYLMGDAFLMGDE